MKYVPPIGASDDASYIDGNPSIGVEGSPVPAAAIEHPQREIMAVIEAAGLTPTAANLSQLLQAIQVLAPPSSGGGSGGDGGGGNDDGWTTVTGQRAKGVWYTNSSTNPLSVSISWSRAAGWSGDPTELQFITRTANFDDFTYQYTHTTPAQNTSTLTGQFTVTVPAGYLYEFGETRGGGGIDFDVTVVSWKERY